MIHVFKLKFLYRVSFIFLIIHIAFAQQYPETNALVSNDIFQLAGSGDTLWMLSSKGVNYHLHLTDSTMDWRGFKDLKGWFITYGSGHTLIRLMENDEVFYKSGIPDRLWLFSITAPKQPRFIKLPFNAGGDSVNNRAYFQASHAVWFQDYFWISCMHGGVVRYSVTDGQSVIFYPGHKDGYDEASFSKKFALSGPDTSSFPFNDSAFVLNVAEDSEYLWVFCKTALWSFNPLDTTWIRITDSLSTEKVSILEIIQSRVVKKIDTTLIYTVIREKLLADTVMSLYKYNSVSKQWKKSFSKDTLTLDFVFGKGNYTYMINYQNSGVQLYIDSTNPINQSQPYLDFASFDSRIDKANADVYNFSKTDIHYAIHGRDTIFAIATDKGLFYSINEHYDEQNAIPFTFIGRNIPLSSGLKQIYAVPGIINDTHREAVFAYNLAKDDFVTIDVFDFNMDHVVRITEKSWRQAGKHKISGRSTISTYDRWDGTKNGRPVAPGVYYFRIKPEKENAQFGKIIVAKN